MARTFDPATQQAINAAREAIADAEKSLRATQEMLARLKERYARIDALDARVDAELNAEVTKIMRDMDEDTLDFLQKTSSGSSY